MRALLTALILIAVLAVILIVPWHKLVTLASIVEAEQPHPGGTEASGESPNPLALSVGAPGISSFFTQDPILNTGDVYFIGDPIPIQVANDEDRIDYTLEWVLGDAESIIGETYHGTGAVIDVPGKGRLAFLPTSMVVKKGVYVLSGEGMFRRRVLLVDPLPKIYDARQWRVGMGTSMEAIEQFGAALADEFYRVGNWWPRFDLSINTVNAIGSSDDPSVWKVSPQFEAFINRADELGLEPIPRLMRHYSEISQPIDLSGEFYRGLHRIQSYYRGKIQYWALGDEPEPGGANSDFTAEQYTTVIKNMSLTIKGLNPNAKIIAGELAHANQPVFTQGLLRAEIQPYWDILSGHRMLAGLGGGANSGSVEYRLQLSSFDQPVWDTMSSGSVFGGPSEREGTMQSRFPIQSDEDTLSGINKAIFRTFCLESQQGEEWIPAYFNPNGGCTGADLFIGRNYNATLDSVWALKMRWIDDTTQEFAHNHKVANLRAAADMVYGAKPVTRIPNTSIPNPNEAAPTATYDRVDGYVYQFGDEYLLSLWQDTGSTASDRELFLTTNDPIVLFDSFGNRYPLRNQNGGVKVWVRQEVIYLRGFTTIPNFAVDDQEEDPPYFTTTPVTQAVVGQPYTYNAWAYDSDPPASGENSLPRIVYELIEGPEGMRTSVNTSVPGYARRSALLEWTPTKTGKVEVTIRATSEQGAPSTADQTFTIDVVKAEDNLVPIFVSQPTTTYARPGYAWWYNANAFDPNGDEVVYSLTQAPVAMTVNPASGFVQWTPTDPGSYQITITASDGLSAATQTFILQVSGITTPLPTFVDVPFDHWAHDSIEAAYRAGFTAGCNQNPRMFCPQNAMSRAEMAVLVLRGAHDASFNPPDPPDQIFADLPVDSWATRWATSLITEGYTAGCSRDPLAFCPWQGNTRAEGAVFFLRMIQGPSYVPPEPVGVFSDVPIDFWGAKWIETAYQAGLIQPCSQEPLMFCPDAPLTRDLAAWMMVKAKGLEAPPP